MTKPPKPKVSIIAITYNHEQYIRQAFDGFVSQQTDFPFEIIVGDDHSTDGTVKIINEYTAKYPDLFKPIIRSKNVGIPQNFADTLNHAKGEYVALCECDDFWTDPRKLQIQADFLDKNPQYALCFHPVNVFFENKNKTEVFPDKKEYKEFTVTELLKRNFIQTNSVMYRKQTYKDFPLNILPVDWYLHLYNAQFGKIGYIDRVMASYRRHEGGVWWANNAEEFWSKNGIKHLEMYKAVLKLYGHKPAYRDALYGPISEAFLAIASLQPSSEDLLSEVLTKFPDMAVESIRRFLADNKKRTTATETLLRSRDEHIRKLEAIIAQQLEELQKSHATLREITSSKAWKLARSVKKVQTVVTKKSN